MSYVPYTQSQGQKKTTTYQTSSSQPYNPYGASSGATTQQTSSSQPYNPYAAYDNSAPAPAPATTSGGYASSSSGYGPPITSSSTTSSYGAGTSNLPDFSQALDRPAPTQQTQQVSTGYSSPYGSSTTTDRGKNPLSGLASAFGGGGGGGNTYNNGSNSNPPPSQQPNYQPDQYQPNKPIGTAPTHGLVSVGNPSRCHKIDYEIKGAEMQLVEIELDPQETVIAEAGAMMFMEDGIEFKTKFGDGSEPKQSFFKKLMAAGGRLLTGESLFITHFTNQGHGKSRVAFAAPYPGNIIAMNMMDLPQQKLICQKDAFLCAAKGTKLSIHWNKRIGSGLFGGEGFILQKLEGDGMAFVHAGGTIIRRELNGEKIRLDTGCLVAFTEGINFDIQLAPGLKTMFFGGEGLFLATLQGHGVVWMQSLPFSRMADRIIQHAPSAGGRRQGEGSALTGGFGDLIDGDGFGFKF